LNTQFFRKLVTSHQLYWEDAMNEGQEILDQLRLGLDVFNRNAWTGHVTASALVFDIRHQRCLTINSRKHQKILLPGGHLDVGESPIQASQRELSEETGLCIDRFVQLRMTNNLVEINCHKVGPNHSKSEPLHCHFDFVYLYAISNILTESFVCGLRPSVEAVDLHLTPLHDLVVNYPKACTRVESILGAIQ
jgi:8-oxo-dGTP pyrophosphatase MutT (NUDIX family)